MPNLPSYRTDDTDLRRNRAHERSNHRTMPATQKMTPAEVAKLQAITAKFKRTMKHGKRKLEIDELSAVKNLEEGFHLFGYDKGDRVRLRDRVHIYNKIVEAMRTKLEEYREKHWHMPAKELQGRLDLVRKDYEVFFRRDEELRRLDESKNLAQALQIEEKRHRNRTNVIHRELADLKRQRKKEQEEVHAAQTLELEHRIKRLPKPRFRMSKWDTNHQFFYSNHPG